MQMEFHLVTVLLLLTAAEVSEDFDILDWLQEKECHWGELTIEACGAERELCVDEEVLSWLEVNECPGKGRITDTG